MDEREFELINIIGKQLSANQRELSRKMDLSLGMINMLIRRLITKGYIRIEQLNKRKVQYILTPKGFSEKMQKSVKYTLNTLNAISLIKETVKDVFIDLNKKGYRNFYIYAQTDLNFLIENAFKECLLVDASLKILKDFPEYKVDGALLIGKENIKDEKFNLDNQFDLLAEISRNHNLTTNF